MGYDKYVSHFLFYIVPKLRVMKSQRSHSWETYAIALSFVAVWIYFAAWIWSGHTRVQLSTAWQLLLLPALVIMAVIFMRRLRRVLASMRGENDEDSPVLPPNRTFNGHARR